MTLGRGERARAVGVTFDRKGQVARYMDLFCEITERRAAGLGRAHADQAHVSQP
jgi:hypothetical protein